MADNQNHKTYTFTRHVWVQLHIYVNKRIAIYYFFAFLCLYSHEDNRKKIQFVIILINFITLIELVLSSLQVYICGWTWRLLCKLRHYGSFHWYSFRVNSLFRAIHVCSQAFTCSFLS